MLNHRGDKKAATAAILREYMAIRKDQNKEDIKASIRKNGTTLRRLSLDWGYTANAVSITLSRPWPNIEAKIAEYLGRAPEDIWPSRYTEHGQPKTTSKQQLSASNTQKLTRGKTKCHRQKGAAA